MPPQFSRTPAIEVTFAFNARVCAIVLALTLPLVAVGCRVDSYTAKRLPDITQDWVGITNGVRVRFDLAEKVTRPIGFIVVEIIGTGSLTTLATGDSARFTVIGTLVSEEPRTVSFLMRPNVQGGGGTVEYFGNFTGQLIQLNSGDELSGAINGTVANTVGPFSGMAGTPIVLLRP